MRLGIDLMGGDRPPKVLFDAVIQAAKYFNSSHALIVFATDEVIASLLELEKQMENAPSSAKIEFISTQEVIEMEDDPIQAVRKKKGSSLVQGIRLLKKKQIDAFITAANTGALVAAATLNLTLLPGIRRPALMATLPTEEGHVAVLDVGGNVSAKADQMVGFAKLGAIFEHVQCGIEKPVIGLLNVGVESKKGTLEHRKAYQKLEAVAKASSKIQFIGNVEGRELFQGKVNVLVTDGFTGNVLLKASEGVAYFILDSLKKTHASSPSNHTQQLISQMHSQFSESEYPGAILLGAEGVVLKCHGNASSKSFFQSIKASVDYLESGLIEKMKCLLEDF